MASHAIYKNGQEEELSLNWPSHTNDACRSAATLQQAKSTTIILDQATGRLHAYSGPGIVPIQVIRDTRFHVGYPNYVLNSCRKRDGGVSTSSGDVAGEA